MCKTKQNTKTTDSITQTSKRSSLTNKNNKQLSSTSSTSTNNLNYTSTSSTTTTTSFNFSSTTTTTSRSNSKKSLSNIKDTLLKPENPNIYSFSEILCSTNNFLSKPFSSSSSSTSWRCQIRNRDAIIFQRKLHRTIDPSELRRRLGVLCRTHHSSLVKLLGASVSGSFVYIVYVFEPNCASLTTCLRNPKNPSYTVLSTWLSRMQVADDVAQGLDYVHHCSGSVGFVHNHVKSSSILVCEAMNAKVCHFGTSYLCGEADGVGGERRIEGTRGYMAPEFQAGGIVTTQCDVYAFGVVVLELVSGEEALRYVYDESGSGGYRRVSVIETGRQAASGGNVRRWADKRLSDSFPVEVVEKMVALGLECVEDDPEKRPDMGKVAGRVSKLYLESKYWAERISMPVDFSVSVGPR